MLSWSSIAKRLNVLEAKSANKHNYTNMVDDGWYCAKADCLYGVKGLANYSSRRFCNGCYRPRAVAERPDLPQARPQRPQQGTASSFEQAAATKENKKREARTQKRKLKNAARLAWNNKAADKDSATPAPAPVATATVARTEPVSPPRAVASTEPAQPRTSSRLELPKPLQDQLPLLLPAALKPILDLLALEITPAPLELRSPEEVLNKVIGERGPSAKVAKVVEHQGNIDKLKIMLLEAKSSGFTDVETMLQAKLDAAEAALTKAAKDAPSPLAEMKAMIEEKASYEVVIQARRDQQAKGATKASERKAQMKNHIAALKSELQALETGLDALTTENNKAHTERAQQMAELDSKVLAQFDVKIATLKTSIAATPQPAVQAVAPPPTTATDSAAAASQAQVTALALLSQPSDQDIKSMKELEEARKTIASLTAKVAAASSKLQQEFEKHFDDIQATHLPAVGAPSAETLPVVGALHIALESWVLSGGNLPFEWDALKATAGGGDIVKIIRCLMGSVWDKWYGDEPPQGSWIVPRQFANILFHCLAKVNLAEEPAEKQKEAERLGIEGADAIRASTKRLRTQ